VELSLLVELRSIVVFLLLASGLMMCHCIVTGKLHIGEVVDRWRVIVLLQESFVSVKSWIGDAWFYCYRKASYWWSRGSVTRDCVVTGKLRIGEVVDRWRVIVLLQESFISVKSWIDDLRKLADPLVVVVVGNKSDLAEQRTVDPAGACQSLDFIQHTGWHVKSGICTLCISAVRIFEISNRIE